MSTFNRTFSVKHGIDVANTIIVDSNRNVSNINLLNVATANITTIENAQLTASYNQANAAYTAANSAANTVRVSANTGSTQNKVGLNFNNSGTINVSVGAGTSGNANIEFALRPTGVTPLTYGGATNVPVLTIDSTGRVTAASNVEIGGGTVFEVNTGLGLSGGPITTSGTISANIASTTVQGITKLIDVVTSTDSSNAATAAAVNLAFGLANTANTTATDALDTAVLAYEQANVAYTNSNTKVQSITTSNAGLLVTTTDSNNVKTVVVNANVASTTDKGVVQLSDSVTTTSSTLAATPTAVKTAYDTAVVALGRANDAYVTANTSANTVKVSANGGSTLSKSELNFVNTSTISVTVTSGTGSNANVAFSVTGASAADAYNQANTAYQAANVKVETITSGLGITVTDSGAAPNVGKTIAANVASTTTQGITKLIDSVSSTDTANAATANSVKWAYDYADTKVSLNPPSGSQTIAGNVTITDNLEVQGNLFLSGNTTLINVTTLNVTDPIIYLAANNEVDDIVDIGFVGGRNNAGTYAHTGLIRHASDDKFYLFDNYEPEPANNVIDVEHVSFAVATLRANLEANSITLNGVSVSTVGDVATAYGQANAAYLQANSVYDVANLKIETIVSGGEGLTITNDSDAANLEYTITAANASTSIRGITKLVDSVTSSDTANAATANAVTWLGTTKVSKTGDTMTGKLTINVTGEGLEVAQANVSANIKVDQLFVKTATLTTTSTSQATLDTWSTDSYTSAKYWVQMKEGTNVHTTEVLLIQESGTNAYVTEYGSIQSGPSLGTITASVTGGVASLLVTPASSSSTTFKAVRYGVI